MEHFLEKAKIVVSLDQLQMSVKSVDPFRSFGRRIAFFESGVSSLLVAFLDVNDNIKQEYTFIKLTLPLSANVTVMSRGFRIETNEVIQGFANTTGLTKPFRRGRDKRRITFHRRVHNVINRKKRVERKIIGLKDWNLLCVS